jgi:hypothetical protein
MVIGTGSPLDEDLINKYRRQLDEAYAQNSEDHLWDVCASQEYLEPDINCPEDNEITYPDMDWLPSDVSHW